MGANAAAIPSSAAAPSARLIIPVLLQASESAVSGTTATAMAAVETEIVSDEAAGDRWKPEDRAGSSAWTQYSVMKVVMPAAKSAPVARRNPGVPRMCAAGDMAESVTCRR